ncbi:MAG: DinB family protein [Chloroflexota bacterium]|nr:DinB family protein [Chloroflexota bacterium]
MDLLDRLLAHDAWTTRQLLLLAQPLSEAQWTQPFDIGHVTLRATLEHMISNVETWTALMNGEQHPDAQPTFEGLSAADLLARHDAAMTAFTALAHRIRAAGSWDALWVDILDDPPQEKSYGGAIGHVITHNMHHRSEVMHMLHRLGVENVIEGDVLSWESAMVAT